MAQRGWSDLNDSQRAAVVVGSVVEVALTTVAPWDLARQPSSRVRGPKLLWSLACFVQPVGPIAYLLFGRRPRSPS
jgi:hypothetical protein